MLFCPAVCRGALLLRLLLLTHRLMYKTTQNDRLLCVLNLCILAMMLCVRGVSAVLHAEPWQLLELVVVLGSGLLSLIHSTWCVRCCGFLTCWPVCTIIITCCCTNCMIVSL